jgi:hypothetical protein
MPRYKEKENEIKKTETFEPEEETSEQEKTAETSQPPAFSPDEIEKIKLENELLKKQIGQMQAELEKMKLGQQFISQTNPFSQNQPSSPQTLSDEEIHNLLYENPKKAIEIIKNEVLKSVTPYITQLQAQIQAEQIRQYFYSTYPDLKGYEKIVAVIATEVTEQMPNVSLETQLAEIAKRTREYIATLRGQPTKAGIKGIGAESGKKTAPETTSKREEEIIYSPEEELRAELEARQEFLKKRIGGK